MSTPDEILRGLDPEQRKAATALHGPVCILAGAGTGKTRAITHRIAYGVASGVFDPHRTLALTFTARAAAEMRTRLRDLGVDGVQARTFHSAALRQLQYFWPQAVGGQMPTLVENKVRLLTEVAHRMRMTVDRAGLRDLAGEIEWAKVSLHAPEGYAEAARDREMPAGWTATTVARLYTGYEEAKTARNMIDFEDVLLILVGILSTEPKIAATVREQYRVFVVDEYQDVSPLQHRLLDLWLGDRQDLCVVGDSSQTIYSFTGATSRFLTGFRERYPEATMVKLVRDYRSSPQIVGAANTLLAERTQAGLRDRSLPFWPEPLALSSQRPSGPDVVFAECQDDEAEAGWVAQRIQGLFDDGVPAAEIAVLFRTNSQSEAFETALSAAGIGYQLRGGERFFSRREVREGVLQLRAAAREAQDLVGADVVQRVKDVLSSLGYSDTPPSASGAARERWESLHALVNLADQLAGTREDFTLVQLVAELDERAQAQHAPTVQGVTLASLHSAKGLEWDAVFLVGLSEGLMPISFADTPAEVDEERRLLYVGITRARQHLHLTWTLARSGGGRANRRPSRFLRAIDPTLGGTREHAPAAAMPARRPRRGATVAVCRTCGRPLETGAERKTGRCVDCPALYDEGVLDALKDWRSHVAKTDKVPAFVVFTDATLEAIAETMPATPAELIKVKGVGKSKLDRFGQDVLDLLHGTSAA
ncbi:ATP-dependent DNA helicase UvrD2 [Micrococcus sp. ACRRV]|uniref:ATP-dependent DNA helicase UvrD2 n=1 Tax=Micrococcus sp. ACRRV TaxID=2918203 RepID=UPI001EF18EAB|nr:ATP-dependent DNA helicase UvrD2 [Micrococcus sp. ACRRV]MCG7423410.1 ATP-dependent DNA helicase UvrD2 [Micrococcus sp. ACRRV]